MIGLEGHLMMIAAVIVLLVLIAISIYNATSHKTIADPDRLCSDAEIFHVGREVVGLKGSKRYRTTVSFDDGFTFISHKTEEESFVWMYHISIPAKLQEEILSDAIRAHEKAVTRHNKRIARRNRRNGRT